MRYYIIDQECGDVFIVFIAVNAHVVVPYCEVLEDYVFFNEAFAIVSCCRVIYLYDLNAMCFHVRD